MRIYQHINGYAADRGGTYYDKDKHVIAIREHRQYKQGLFVDGKIE